MTSPARVAAYETLLAVESSRADLPHALARARQALTDERDRALAGEIATGTLRWQGAFDAVISRFATRPLRHLDREVLMILRLTMFQLLHLDRVPASAAVNDAVSLTRRAGKTSAAPMVNAILRRVSRERNRLPLPTRPEPGADRETLLQYLSVTLSHPRWLVERWLDRHGFENTERWAQFNNEPAKLTLRTNSLKARREELADALRKAGVRTAPTPLAPDGLVVQQGNPLLTPLAGTGLFVVQEEASQLVALMTGVKPGEVVLDACASPGGKTTAMAAAMNDRGTIVATDVRKNRVALLASTVAASGASHVHIVRADATALPFGERFDCVLLDAPCSGLGTIRRDPDVKWRRTEFELSDLSAMQLRMLRACAAVLKASGRVVYSTCSGEPEENEQVVRAFIAESGYREVPRADLPASARSLVNEQGHLRTYPFRDGVEAFFAAVLVRG